MLVGRCRGASRLVSRIVGHRQVLLSVRLYSWRYKIIRCRWQSKPFFCLTLTSLLVIQQMDKGVYDWLAGCFISPVVWWVIWQTGSWCSSCYFSTADLTLKGSLHIVKKLWSKRIEVPGSCASSEADSEHLQVSVYVLCLSMCKPQQVPDSLAIFLILYFCQATCKGLWHSAEEPILVWGRTWPAVHWRPSLTGGPRLRVSPTNQQTYQDRGTN